MKRKLSMAAFALAMFLSCPINVFASKPPLEEKEAFGIIYIRKKHKVKKIKVVKQDAISGSSSNENYASANWPALKK